MNWSAASSKNASNPSALQKPCLPPIQGQAVQTDPRFQIPVLKNPSLATVGHHIIVPTHRLNDTDSLQQMLTFPSLNLLPPTREQTANPSLQTPGG